MSWIFYSLVSSALFTLVIFLDKFILSKRIKDYLPMVIYTSLVACFAAVFFWVATGFALLSLTNGFIVILTGVIGLFSALVYFKALSYEEATVINILLQLTPVLSLVFAFVFLGEKISLPQLGGFVLILAATIILSVDTTQIKPTMSPAFWYIILFGLLNATSGVLIKYAVNLNSFWPVLTYESVGIALGGAILWIVSSAIRKSFAKNIKTLTANTIGLIGVNESIFVVAKSMTYYAFSLGPVGLVSVLGGTQVFFAVVYGYIVTIFAPHIMKEDISRKAFSKKIFSAVMILVGIWLISL